MKKLSIRNKIITSLVLSTLFALGTGCMVHQHNIQAKALEIKRIEELKKADKIEAEKCQKIIDKISRAKNQEELNALRDLAKKIKDPARRTRLTDAFVKRDAEAAKRAEEKKQQVKLEEERKENSVRKKFV